jgi:putative PIN family toxin of toxin-antitoxin system
MISTAPSSSTAVKVVPDTVNWVSYGTHADGARARAIERAVRHRVRLFTSGYILSEVERIIPERMGESPRLARLTVASIRRMCTLVALPQAIASYVNVDPKDDPIIQTAITGMADYIVTADKALLVVGKVRDVEIISQNEWLSRLPADD